MVDAELPEKYRLSFLVGEIVRNDVSTENETRMLWRRLQAVGLLDPDKFSYGRLFGKLRKALASPQVPGAFRSIALDVLSTADAGHKTRNAFAHTIFMHHPKFGDDLVRPARHGVESWQLSKIEDAARDSLRTSWRMRGVWIIAPYWIGGPTDGYETAELLRSWTRVAMGHIADVPGVIEGTPGPAPEPAESYEKATAQESALRSASLRV